MDQIARKGQIRSWLRVMGKVARKGHVFGVRGEVRGIGGGQVRS